MYDAGSHGGGVVVGGRVMSEKRTERGRRRMSTVCLRERNIRDSREAECKGEKKEREKTKTFGPVETIKFYNLKLEGSD